MNSCCIYFTLGASSSDTEPANVAILNNDWFGGFSGW